MIDGSQINWNIIAVDFDGTLCENKYPKIGEPNEQIIAYIRGMKKLGARLILWTCRAGKLLQRIGGGPVLWNSDRQYWEPPAGQAPGGERHQLPA